MTVGPRLNDSLEPLCHCVNVASLTFLRDLFPYVHLHWLSWLFSLIFMGGPLILIDCIIFSLIFPRCPEKVNVDSFSPCIARFSNSLPAECFSFTYNDKFRVNRHFLSLGFF